MASVLMCALVFTGGIVGLAKAFELRSNVLSAVVFAWSFVGCVAGLIGLIGAVGVLITGD